jgi:hypothetical protein
MPRWACASEPVLKLLHLAILLDLVPFARRV